MAPVEAELASRNQPSTMFILMISRHRIPLNYMFVDKTWRSWWTSARVGSKYTHEVDVRGIMIATMTAHIAT